MKGFAMKRISVLLAGAVLAALAVIPLSAQAGNKPVVKAPWAVRGKDEILPGIDAGKVTGNIVTAGSSTVFPLSEKIVEMFREEGYAGNITIDSIGTGAGFERWAVSGETDIANASRAITDRERAAAKAIGRDVLEFRVGTDAVAVCVSSQNTFLTSVTKEQLAKLFSTAVYWSDVDPSWPRKEILRFSPGTDSGTFDYFVEAVFRKDRKPLLSAKNLQMSEDDNILVQGIEGSPYGIGFFGYAYFEENKGRLKVLSLDGVQPDRETVDSGKYLLARPLFLYASAKTLRDKPQVAAFIAYYLQNVNRGIRRVGYFAAKPEALKASKQVWLAAMEARN